MNELWQAFGLRAVRSTLLGNFLLTFSVLTIGYVIMHFGIEKRLVDYATTDLTEDLAFIARPLQNSSQAEIVRWCQDIPRNQGKRFSVIDADGKVLCDSHADIESLVNHADRPEFIEAINYGQGASARLSSTREQAMVYAALKLEEPTSQNPTVLRIALPQGGLSYYLGKMRHLIISNLLGVLVVLGLIFLWSSFRVARPLAALERKLGLFRPLSGADNKMIQTRNEWEKVEITVDQIYRDLNHKMDELARSDDKIATIVESIADGLLAITTDEKVLLANNAFARAFGHKSSDNLSDRPLLDIIRNVDVRKVYRDCMKSCQHQTHQFQQGNTTFELQVYPLLQGGHQLMGAVGIFNNITEARLLQKMREDFVANVSHEVRTPLTAIKGFAQILKELGPHEHESFSLYATKIEHNVNRLANLFQDILSLSVLESRQEVTKQAVDARYLVGTVSSNVALTHANKNIKLSSFVDTATLWGDPHLLEQILTNLLDNAFKYTHDNGHIEIKVYQHEEHDFLEVIDNGVGIPEESLLRIFERFYRVDASRSREVGGTGLGLAIVKHALNKHRGSVRVESVLGEGSRFIVKLPRQKLV